MSAFAAVADDYEEGELSPLDIERIERQFLIMEQDREYQESLAADTKKREEREQEERHNRIVNASRLSKVAKSVTIRLKNNKRRRRGSTVVVVDDDSGGAGAGASAAEVVMDPSGSAGAHVAPPPAEDPSKNVEQKREVDKEFVRTQRLKFLSLYNQQHSQ